MTINKEFEQAVLDQDLLMVRIMLKNSLMVDPTQTDFDQRLSYAAARLTALYDEHDGELLQQASALWTEDDLDEQMVAMVQNFSRERVALVKSICRQLYDGRALQPQLQASSAASAASAQVAAGTARPRVQTSGGSRGAYIPRAPRRSGAGPNIRRGAGLAVAGIGVVILGAAIPKTIITVAGVVLAIAGGGLMLKGKPRRFL
ncbi:hypothetical protein GXP70_02905 [Paenibacillus lycopersici]|uniref:Uncharacterized protein n=1 Tax=Paenibacillus lycopersici TaxID=2704462 RepID=A0A6C0FSF9_9BACL|nr:hypothetical protein [Paenibacillus lycopersici]QHT59012.1 hypothetical protein GXP70_02905 [Paenibacillus lycopersici]